MSRVGARVPQATLAELRDGVVCTITTETLFTGARVVMIGVPGAFTPVCTEKHVPDFVANAEVLRAAGFDRIVCLAPNDPWTLARWSAELDPERKVLFLSDGNLEFTRKMGLVGNNADLFLGDRTERFLMIARNGIIERLAVEANVLLFTCTGADAAVI